MKIKHVRIENFKGIKGPLDIDFAGPDGEPARSPASSATTAPARRRCFRRLR